MNMEPKTQDTAVTVVTIGVYGFDADSFFAALRDASVDTFCDIRQRRGVRGASYAFANSQRLQQRLEALGIRYVHKRDLAPTPAVRARQKEADALAGVAKRQRDGLDPVFIEAYEDQILSDFEPRSWLDGLGNKTRVVALCCVEREPAACHRSLIAARLHADLGLAVVHLRPLPWQE